MERRKSLKIYISINCYFLSIVFVKTNGFLITTAVNKVSNFPGIGAQTMADYLMKPPLLGFCFLGLTTATAAVTTGSFFMTAGSFFTFPGFTFPGFTFPGF